MTNLIWRLPKLPTMEEMTHLIDKGIITKDEARAILFKDPEEKIDATDLEEIKDELKLLRKIVTATSPTVIIREIHSAPQYIRTRPYWNDYNFYCNAVSAAGYQGNLGTVTSGLAQSGNYTTAANMVTTTSGNNNISKN